MLRAYGFCIRNSTWKCRLSHKNSDKVAGTAPAHLLPRHTIALAFKPTGMVVVDRNHTTIITQRLQSDDFKLPLIWMVLGRRTCQHRPWVQSSEEEQPSTSAEKEKRQLFILELVVWWRKEEEEEEEEKNLTKKEWSQKHVHVINKLSQTGNSAICFPRARDNNAESGLLSVASLKSQQQQGIFQHHSVTASSLCPTPHLLIVSFFLRVSSGSSILSIHHVLEPLLAAGFAIDSALCSLRQSCGRRSSQRLSPQCLQNCLSIEMCFLDKSW